MTRRVLGELDRSKLLNELELMPAPENRRIDAATGAAQPPAEAGEVPQVPIVEVRQ